MQGEFGDALPLGRYASLQYLQYAIATVKDRALPRVGDGQKPVQGRILYTMWDNGTRAGTKRTKSAAVVGRRAREVSPARRRCRCTTRWCGWRRTSPCAIRWWTARATSARATATKRRPTDTPKRA